MNRALPGPRSKGSAGGAYARVAAAMSRGTGTEPAPLQEIIAHSKPWVGRYSEAGQEQSLQLHMVFGLANQVEGIGRDANGEFTLSGNYTDEREVYFVLKYHSVYHPPRTFAGTRQTQRDAQISGRWWVDADGSPSGDFMLSHEDAERRFAPSYDIDRLKLYYVLERLATGGFGIVSRVRRAVDGKVLVWKELNYARSVVCVLPRCLPCLLSACARALSHRHSPRVDSQHEQEGAQDDDYRGQYSARYRSRPRGGLSQKCSLQRPRSECMRGR